jgi:hypothetical protein
LLARALQPVGVLGHPEETIVTRARAMETLVGLFFLFFLYFLPTMVAFSRKHHNSGALFVLNLFLGWTFLGWVVAMVWSLTQVQRESR